MRGELAASILSFDPGRLREAVARLMQASVDWIHFDVMDGQFVPPITFGADLVASLRDLGPTPFEAHLMTLTPERHVESFARAGCRRIIFQVEVISHPHRLCQELRSEGIEAGIAINPGTPAGALAALIDVIDLALVMTVNPGWGGQQMISSCLDKARELRALRPELAIEVDGGIDAETLPRAQAAGANVFVSGSHLARARSVEEGVAELRRAMG